MKRTRVVCFVNHTAETGGAEFALSRLVAGMDRNRWQPVVVLGEDGPAVSLFRSRGVETYVLPMPRSIGKTRRGSLSRRAWMRPRAVWDGCAYAAKLVSFFRTRAVEIVHTNSMKAHLLGGVAARMCRIPLVWHLRDCLHASHLPHAALVLMRSFAKMLPHRIICVSNNVAECAMGSDSAQRTSVVYDGLDPRCFDDPAPEPDIHPPAVWRVGMVGRFASWKGQHVFLEAAAKLIQRGHRIQFELIGAPLFGEDAYAARLQQFVEANAMQSHVKFVGFVQDAPQRLRSWHALVHASTAPDPCPNVVLEAMAAGVPVVGADGGGVPELLDEGRCGALFPMDDPNALCRQLETLLAKPLLRSEYALRGRERALRCFRSERVAREVSEIWEKVYDPAVYQRRRWAWIEASSPATRQASGEGLGSSQSVPGVEHKNGGVLPVTQ